MKKSIFISTFAILIFSSVFFYFNDLQSKNISKDLNKKPDIKTENSQIAKENLLLNKLLPSERNNVEVFKKTAPLVVFIHNLRYYNDYNSYETTEVKQGAGSGFIWDDKGHIVTNFHVINGHDGLLVTLQNGKSLKATVVGVESKKDIAVLKVNPKELNLSGFSDNIANSSELLAGQKTIAIGNPFGLDHSLSVGVISALGRSFPSIGGVTIRDMIQTDAAINPGNSGGPLLNSLGQLIGMNTAIFSKSGSSAGIGFAVPSNTIKRIVNQLINFGKVIRPGIGVQHYSEQVSKNLGIKGIIIQHVPQRSSAEKAGLRGTYRDREGKVQLGDIIVGINSEKIRTYDDIYNALERKKVGETVKITFLRNNKKRSINLKLIELK